MRRRACPYCGDEDTLEHVVFKSKETGRKRQNVCRKVDKELNAENIIIEMMERREIWDIGSRYVCDVINSKKM